jgi:hypothetical protein
MIDESFQFSTDDELADQINRAMDGWDSKPTPEERARIATEFVATRRAWERKLASLSPEDRARVASEDADAAEALVAARKGTLVRAEAAHLYMAQLNVQAEHILAHTEARIRWRLTTFMPSDEVDAIRNVEAASAESELQAWITEHPPPTLADDERAISEVLGEEMTDG